MKSLLPIGAEALQAVRKWARNLIRTAGKSRPEALRQDRATAPSSITLAPATSCCAFRPISTRGTSVTNELVNQLRDESGV
jgi:hypothetical protein